LIHKLNDQKTAGSIPPRKVGVVSAFLILLIAAAVLNTQNVGWYSLFKLAVYGQATTGTIVEKQPQFHQTCKFEYQIGTAIFQGRSQGCYAKLGERVQVTYLAENTKISLLASPARELVTQIIAVLFISLFAGMGAAISMKRFQKT
jgi:hypothetical protein